MEYTEERLSPICPRSTGRRSQSSGQFVTAVMLVGLLAGHAQAQPPKGALELNTALMETTFRIQGQSASGPTTGTGFILAIPYPDVPGQGRMVLITAAHV
jgi:hypothetical protein